MAQFFGTSGDDTLPGAGEDNSGMDTLFGGAGNDLLFGGASADTLLGEGGSDTLDGGTGADSLDGGDGFDIASYAAASASVVARLDTGLGYSSDAAGDRFTSIEGLAGSARNDILVGNAGGNGLDGRAGDDDLRGYAGDDTLAGGLGADRMDGGAGFDIASFAAASASVVARLDTGLGYSSDAAGDRFISIEGLVGSAQNDILVGNGGANRLEGRGGPDDLRGYAGDDTLAGGLGADTLRGGDGSDTASYEAAASGMVVRLDTGLGYSGEAAGDVLQSIEALAGSAYSDTLVGNGVDNRLGGGAAADDLRGYAGNDTLSGGTGDDTLSGSLGADALDGGVGFDIANYVSAASGLVVRLDTGLGYSGEALGDVLTSIEGLIGSSHDDTLVGEAGANRFEGRAGNDDLRGYGGNDTIDGGLGDDILIGGQGSDVLIGGGQFDLASYVGAMAGVVVRLDTGLGYSGDAAGDTLATIEGLIGSAHDDILVGNAEGNVLNGRQGSDDLRGYAGDDTLAGGTGADRLEGGAGIDTVDYSGSSSAVEVRLHLRNGVYGDAAGDTYIGIEAAVGSSLADRIYGNNYVSDQLSGGPGNDSLWGFGGDDTLEGGSGVNVLDGGAGEDTFLGVGLGDGTLTGGAGRDVYVLSGPPTVRDLAITDFETGAGGDVIDLTGILPHLLDYASDEDPFATEHVRLFDQGGDTLLQIDGNGPEGGAEFQTVLRLAGVAAADFDASNFAPVGNPDPSSGLVGTSADDGIAGTDQPDLIQGLDGHDQLRGGIGDDTIYGGAGDDRIEGAAGTDLLVGGTGNDTFVGVGSDDATDTLTGGAGRDVYMLKAGIQTPDVVTDFEGGIGGDIVEISEILLELDGYLQGSDPFESGFLRVVSTAEGAALQRDLDGIGTNHDFSTILRLQGLPAGDFTADNATPVFPDLERNTQNGYPCAYDFTGTENADLIDGGSGDDMIRGRGGDDILVAGGPEPEPEWCLGAVWDGDLLFGGDGNDILFSNTNPGSQTWGEAGNDTLLGGIRTIDGGEGDDVIVSLQYDAEGYSGGDGDDFLRVVEEGFGSSGNDWIIVETGSAGGGSGNDSLWGGSGANELIGAQGNDVIFAGAGADRASGDGDSDLIFGESGDDTLWGGNRSTVYGVDAGDTLDGGSGDDILHGQDGDDVLFGGAGADTLDGGAGKDMLTGGADPDRFVYANISDSGLGASQRDVIGDFSGGGVDLIDLRAIDANADVAGNQAFTFIGSSGFSGAAGELRAGVIGDATVIEGNVNGDLFTDFQIELTGVYSLSGADFIL